ncbi:MAG TPA: aminotransferase class I/II-fold pyridoxal phosphate-dependent enzyme [Solirubrobacter sp.]|nr:aminotransferase class I/II-fold pyridoxal phosphate-dependent enzyme [Solirubrobacter sp.]
MDRLLDRGSDKWTAYPPDVLPAWVAEMDFALAPPVKAVLVDAIERDDLGYVGRVEGMLEAFAGFASRRFSWTVDVEQVALVTDVMVGLREVVRELTQPDDQVILNTPAYPPYFRELRRPLVEVPLLEDFALDIEGIDAAFARGARAMVLCNPHNPTGRISPRSELEALAAVADAHGAWIIADEIHAPLTLGGETFVPWLTVAPHGVALTSASKAFNLTALKLGLAVGEPVERLSDDLRDHAGYLGVLAAEAAFRDGDEWLDETLALLRSNHSQLPSLLPEGVCVAVPAQASFLAWLDCRGAGLGDDPAAVFLERGRVALYSGLHFGAPGAGFARLNVGTTPELLEEAVSRVAAALTT